MRSRRASIARAAQLADGHGAHERAVVVEARAEQGGPVEAGGPGLAEREHDLLAHDRASGA
jgi:hypothetical protein